MPLFKVVAGKHALDDGTFARAGETVELSEEEAANPGFVGKFAPVAAEAAPVAVPAPVAAEEAQEEGKDE